MKNLIFSILLLLLSGIHATAQTTGLFTYEGGYFIKNGDNWTEYRPGDSDDVWATYTQSSEEANFYLIRNSECSLGIPKIYDSNHMHIWIWQDDDWKTIYQMKQVYNYFEDQSRNIYAYNEGGYFVRDGNEWREYRPVSRPGIWASYEQYDEDDHFFYMNNSACTVCVPKADYDGFYILNDGEWEKCYTCSAIYNDNNNNNNTARSQDKYDYIFNFNNYKYVSPDDTFIPNFVSPSKLYISRKGNALIEYGDNKYEFEFKQISIAKDHSYFVLYPEADSMDQYVMVFPTWSKIKMNDIRSPFVLDDGENQQQFDEISKLIIDKTFYVGYLGIPISQ